MKTIPKKIFERTAPTILIVQVDERLKAELLGLADHIGIEPEEALRLAISHWVGQNAAIFSYTHSTDVLQAPETK